MSITTSGAGVNATPPPGGDTARPPDCPQCCGRRVWQGDPRRAVCFEGYPEPIGDVGVLEQYRSQVRRHAGLAADALLAVAAAVDAVYERYAALGVPTPGGTDPVLDSGAVYALESLPVVCRMAAEHFGAYADVNGGREPRTLMYVAVMHGRLADEDARLEAEWPAVLLVAAGKAGVA